MKEDLLQFIWQFQYFNKTELISNSGEPIQILLAGQLNTNQGPDFSDAKIKIGKTIWAGTVELHIKTSDWRKHNHQTDTNYNNVILHVVWEDDLLTNTIPEKNIPVLELKGKVSGILLERFEDLMNSNSFIPCENSINDVRDITWKSWKDRLLAERLLRKSSFVEACLEQNNCHWEEIFWWLLARNFGIKVNAEAFEAIARSLSINILAKHKLQIHQLEALLLGQAGLLEGNFKDNYPVLLQKEFKFLKNKYNLKPIHAPVFFLRMRPGNFPTIRLAQLAILIQRSTHLFSKIKAAKELKEVKAWLDVTANDYWYDHYKFDETSGHKKKKLGTAMIDNIIINTICPVLFANGNYYDEHQYKEKALKWLEETTAEKNNITKGFQKLGIENKTAFDSQALIELRNEYCIKKRCLDCGVGNTILKN